MPCILFLNLILNRSGIWYQLIEDYFNAPIRVEAAPTGTPLENIVQSGYEVPNFNTKVNLLNLLLSSDASMTKVLIFVATKSLADQLFEQLELKFPEIVGVIHSNKEQNYRFNTVKQFKAGVFKYIISTDVMARGIDVAEVTHVINFDTPDVPENFTFELTGRYIQSETAAKTPTRPFKEKVFPSTSTFTS